MPDSAYDPTRDIKRDWQGLQPQNTLGDRLPVLLLRHPAGFVHVDRIHELAPLDAGASRPRCRPSRIRGPNTLKGFDEYARPNRSTLPNNKFMS